MHQVLQSVHAKPYGPATQSCSRGRCLDPCSLRAACGKNAICSVVLHKPRCECPQCHIGQPLVACRPDPGCRDPGTQPSVVEGCTSDKSCPLSQACSLVGFIKGKSQFKNINMIMNVKMARKLTLNTTVKI